MKKILITGASGYIGSHSCLEFLNSGYDIIALDNFSNSKVESLNRVSWLCNKKFEIKECDLLHKENLKSIFSENDIGAVIHFAGLKSVSNSVKNPIEYYNNNVVGTVNLLSVMQSYNVKQIVFSSSATVYGNPDFLPITEKHKLQTTNPYGETKLMIEKILKDLYKSDQFWNISILRYFNPCGAHESGQIGEDPNGIPNNLMPFVAQVAAGNIEKLEVFGDDYNTKDGTGIRDYIHVVDLAKAHVKALNLNKNNTGCTAINLGTGNGYSVLEIVETFKKISGKSIPLVISSRRNGDVASCFADPSKAEKTIGWKAEKNLYEMCKDHWRWQSLNLAGYGA